MSNTHDITSLQLQRDLAEGKPGAKEALRRHNERGGIDRALAAYVAGVQRVSDAAGEKARARALAEGKSEAAAERAFSIYYDSISVKRGRRYAKVIKTERLGEGRSVHSFVDLTNGDILKAASWKAPAKHARGSVYEVDGLKTAGVSPYGVRYLY